MTIFTPFFDNAIGMLTRDGAYTPLGGHSEETIGVAAQELTTPRPAQATGVLVQPIDAGIMFTLDGTDPTVTPGFIISADLLPLYIPVNDKVTLTVVREDADDSSLRYQWVRIED